MKVTQILKNAGLVIISISIGAYIGYKFMPQEIKTITETKEIKIIDEKEIKKRVEKEVSVFKEKYKKETVKESDTCSVTIKKENTKPDGEKTVITIVKKGDYSKEKTTEVKKEEQKESKTEQKEDIKEKTNIVYKYKYKDHTIIAKDKIMFSYNMMIPMSLHDAFDYKNYKHYMDLRYNTGLFWLNTGWQFNNTFQDHWITVGISISF